MSVQSSCGTRDNVQQAEGHLVGCGMQGRIKHNCKPILECTSAQMPWRRKLCTR